jgi:hypothetical protein
MAGPTGALAPRGPVVRPVLAELPEQAEQVARVGANWASGNALGTFRKPAIKTESGRTVSHALLRLRPVAEAYAHRSGFGAASTLSACGLHRGRFG